MWWIIAFCLSILLCALSIQTMWLRRNESPVSMGLKEKELTISEIPYPVVTICPETKANSKKFDIISTFHEFKEKEKLSKIDQSRLAALNHVCEFHHIKYKQLGGKFTNELIYNILQDISVSLNDTLTECTWHFKTYKHCKLFTPILTGDGVCFSFNALNSRDIYTNEMAPEMMIVKKNPNVSNWSMETGYTRGVRPNDYPFRVFSAKKQATLTVSTQLYERDLEWLCHADGQGFKVFLSAPDETAKFTSMSRRFYWVPLLEQVDILIRPTLTYTSKALRKYTPSQRKCFFNSERPLRFFKSYAQDNCLEECLANFTRIECGCAKFSMPRAKDTRICGVKSIECYKKAEWKLLGEDVIDGLSDQNAKSFRENCNCLPACKTILYDAEVDRSNFDWDTMVNSYKIPKEETVGKKPSRLTIRFKDHRVTALKRSEKYSFTHFLSIVGGLLGLFLGISALSIIEFVYYSTLRLFWTIRLWKSRNALATNRMRNISSRNSDSIDNDNKKYENEE